MIAKNIKGKGFAGCVRYVLNNKHELLEAEGVLADNAESIIRSFAMQRSMRSEIAKPVGHIPISFAPEDSPRMTNEFMLQLAKEYMQEMGIGNTQYIVVHHHNTNNDHLHIVYNRIDNDLKLISVNNDYRRNIQVCKKLKDKHGLTYGKGKERVKREKLNHPDKAKYQIYDAVKAAIVNSPDYKTLESLLKPDGVSMKLKLRRGTDIIEGVSFAKNGCSFKGSQVDRLFSHKKLSAMMDIVRQHQETVRQQRPGTPTIFGLKLTVEQYETLKKDSFIFLENMINSKGKLFSGYVFSDDKGSRYFALKDRPDEFIKYGKYEMRRMDKRLIEAGCVSKAKVKYWGGGFAHPYLWKPDAIKDEAAAMLTGYKLLENSDYCQSWGDPREKITETPQILSNSTPSMDATIVGVGKSVGDTATDFGNTLADAGSTIGGLFDIQPSSGSEQQATLSKKKPKKQKGRGQRP